MKKLFKKIILGILVFFLIFIGYLFIGTPPRAEKISWGVNFSQKQAELLGLNWQETYLALLDDLKVKNIKLITHWDLIEPGEGDYNFEDLDWQIEKAEEKGAKLLLVIGMKTGRWPECHEPDWVRSQKSKVKSQKSLLEYIEKIVNRYKNSDIIWGWQVENEPFLKFGICPPLDVQLLDSEIGLVRLLDPRRKIIVTDSGELSLWIEAAKRADVFGTTMYRTIWKEGVGYFNYPIGPRFFHLKKWLAEIFTDQENFIVIELQAEPWISGSTTERPLEEQFQSMNAEKLKENVDFARKVGFPEVYLWGVEWWYWLKVEKNHPELWNQAKELWSQ